ncbi:MAG: hypothetical protein D6731_06610 [Planctomycetota bacterium]|nr:MAG: hypothetical protein D6731_06610 [Planctomycetota bacterium]
MRYVVRRQRVRCGGGERRVLVAAFPLGGGGAACLQLADEGPLRRGGVYLAATDDPEAAAFAPRFDELFADAARKVRAAPDLLPTLRSLLERARDAARACRPQLTPAALDELGAVARAAREREVDASPGPYSLEELVVSALLIFVSEEERYPRPRYRGADVALGRFLEVLGA